MIIITLTRLPLMPAVAIIGDFDTAEKGTCNETFLCQHELGPVRALDERKQQKRPLFCSHDCYGSSVSNLMTLSINFLFQGVSPNQFLTSYYRSQLVPQQICLFVF